MNLWEKHVRIISLIQFLTYSAALFSLGGVFGYLLHEALSE